MIFGFRFCPPSPPFVAASPRASCSGAAPSVPPRAVVCAGTHAPCVAARRLCWRARAGAQLARKVALCADTIRFCLAPSPAPRHTTQPRRRRCVVLSGSVRRLARQCAPLRAQAVALPLRCLSNMHLCLALSCAPLFRLKLWLRRSDASVSHCRVLLSSG